MVFGKLTESDKSPGLPAIPGSLHGYPLSSQDKKSNLRPSASLQELSTYNQLDVEESNLIIRAEKFSSKGLSSFSKEKVPPVISSRRKKWLRVICVLLALLLITCLSFAVRFLYSNWSDEQSKYYVVVDCGSTGTRVYVYQASINDSKDHNLPISLKPLPEGFVKKPGSQNGRAYTRMETEPGFDKLVNNISGLREAIDPLIHWAEKQIPIESHKTTSLFLYATAGVRRLPSSDSEWLLNNAWSILKSSPFLCKQEWVKIITGREEAFYGWIALNHHTKILGSIPKQETYGALDLGGSSLQVTFESQHSNQDETSLKLNVGPVKHHLTAYSLAGYGLNDAFDKSVAHLLKNLPHVTKADLTAGKVVINHPCLHSGYKEQYTCSHCSDLEPNDLGKGGKTKVMVKLTGAPNWEKCNRLAKVAVNLSNWSDRSPGIDCELQPCALPEKMPRPVGKFYAMSGFFVVYRFFNLTTDAALDDVLEKGREFCEKNWEVARKSVAPQPFIEQYCFRAPYVALLLREGLHITDRQVTIGSGNITWTLGVALFEAGKAYSYTGRFGSYDIFRVKLNHFLFFAVLLTSLFVLLCALSCVGIGWAPKFFRRTYLPVFRHSGTTSTSVLNLPAPFRFRRWSPINAGDGRVKMPLSPTVGQSPFGAGGGDIQFADPSLYSSSSGVVHSYSSGNLGQMQFDNSFWPPNRSQMRLQSRRSQSREDLNSSLAEAHLVKT